MRRFILLRQAPKWNLATPDESVVNEIAHAAGVSRTVAAAMVNRGVTLDDAEVYISAAHCLLPNPFLLLNMEKSAKRLAHAIQTDEQVAIWLDYDGDGQTAGALLCWLGRMLGVEFRPYIPDRLSEGYGLNQDGIRQLAEEGISLLVTVDCGITAYQEALLCRDMGMDLIITDHHTPSVDIPDAYSVINPLLPGDMFPFKKLAGVGVAYNLAAATIEILHQAKWFNANRPKPSVEELLPLVAIGTIADVVELRSFNRVMVTQGIERIRQGRHPFVGIRALCEVSAVCENTLSSGQIGFRLAPRLNAGGRLEWAGIGFELLMATNPLVATAHAVKLDELNSSRQEMEELIVSQASAMFESDPALWERKTIVLASPEWHPGVIGIAASRMVERYHRPTVIIALDGETGKGSCRSIKPFDIHEGLCQCSDILERFGGHPMAAGLSLAANKLPAFTKAFENSASYLTEEDLQPVVTIDAEANSEDLSLEICNEVEQMEPFGMGNSKPVFSLVGCKVVNMRVLKGKHLKLELSKNGRGFDAIGFNMSAGFEPKDLVDIAFCLERNEWRGVESLQLQLRALC